MYAGGLELMDNAMDSLALALPHDKPGTERGYHCVHGEEQPARQALDLEVEPAAYVQLNRR